MATATMQAPAQQSRVEEAEHNHEDFAEVITIKLKGDARANLIKLAALLGKPLSETANAVFASPASFLEYLEAKKDIAFKLHSQMMEKLDGAIREFNVLVEKQNEQFEVNDTPIVVPPRSKTEENITTKIQG